MAATFPGSLRRSPCQIVGGPVRVLRGQTNRGRLAARAPEPIRLPTEATPEAWARTKAGLEAAWAEASADDQMYGFLALEAGEPIAYAQLVWLTNGLPYLGGAATLRGARGRGAFRALVHARWDEAAGRGAPRLLVQASRMSAPVLGGLGFQTISRFRILVDTAN